MKESGVAIMGSAMASGEQRSLRAVEQAMSSPLLNDSNIKGARYVLVNVTCGEDEITMDEFGEITDYIQDAAGMSAEVIKGYGVDPSLGDKVNVTIIATGFNSKADVGIQIEKAPAKKVFSLMDEVKAEVTVTPVAEVVAPKVEEITLKPMEMTSYFKEEVKAVETPIVVDEVVAPIVHELIAEVKVEETPIIVNEIVAEEVVVEETPIIVNEVVVEEETPMFVNETEETYVEENSIMVNEIVAEVLAEETPIIVNEVVTEVVEETPIIVNEVVSETPIIVNEVEEVVEPIFEVEAINEPVTFEFEITNKVVVEETPIIVNNIEESIVANTTLDEAYAKAEPIVEAKEENTIVAKVQNDEQLKKAQDRVAKLKELSFKLKSPNGLSELENEPAYKRRNINLDSTPHSSESQVSRYTLSEGDDKKVEIKPNNSFLHDNVD